MPLNLNTKDLEVKKTLDSYSEKDRDFWAFKGRSVREHVHAYFQYPAMMVPQMQGELLSTITKIDGNIKSVFDPFVGSGTVLTEVMANGLNFAGQDINPLAILISKAKSGPFFPNAIEKRAKSLLDRLKRDRSKRIEIDFPGIEKWFTKDVAIDLSRIKRAISEEKFLWFRRFCWVGLAETVRLTSNSRTSTFKLHIRSKQELKDRQVSGLDTFKRILIRNIDGYLTQSYLLKECNYIYKGFYRGDINITFADSRTKKNSPLCDLLITSPPYGDNQTTVPYGQHSFLPLQWIDLSDIELGMDKDLLSNTHAIDSRSLGGSKASALLNAEKLCNLSPAFSAHFRKVREISIDGAKRIASFCYDLNESLDPIFSALRPNAYMVWTIGNRNVANQPVPSDDILTDLLLSRGSVVIGKYNRQIMSKRMAFKNNISTTMACETIIIARRGQ